MDKIGKRGKLSRDQERQAWTEAIEGKKAAPKIRASKYMNTRTEDGYSSIHEAKVARDLRLLADRGIISKLEEQVRYSLVPGDETTRGVTYVADFVYHDKDGLHVLDAKGFKTDVYKLKKRMMWLLLKIKIEEV